MSRDVVFAFFGVSWAASVGRGRIMPEDRLAGALVEHPRVRRLLVADPYRSLAGEARSRLRGGDGAAFPRSETRTLHSPLRWRRSDPARPARAMCRYEQRLRRAALARGLERPALIVAHPLLAGFGAFEWAGPVTYYAWDDWTASEPHRRWWPAYDDAFARLRDSGRRVCAVSDGILRRVAATGPQAVVPNGIEPAEWLAPGEPPAWFRALPRPRLLYVGSLDSRVDVGQVEAVARAFDSGSVTLIGPMLEPDHFAPLRALANVTVRGPAGRADVSGLIAHADAGLVPHVRNALTQSMSPLKLYEYLAGGRPVAAVDLPPIAATRDPRVVLVGPGDGFAAAVGRALEIGPAGDAERKAFVQANSWDRRFERLLDVALAE
jgi:teichuronic acid biosynthesis glycosyltransferase TuaH